MRVCITCFVSRFVLDRSDFEQLSDGLNTATLTETLTTPTFVARMAAKSPTMYVSNSEHEYYLLASAH